MAVFMFGVCVGGLLMLVADAVDNIREDRFLQKKNREKRGDEHENKKKN